MSRRQPSRDSDLGGWVPQGDPRRYGRPCGKKYQQGHARDHSSIREAANKEMQKSLVNPNTFIPHRLLGLQNVLEFHSIRVRHNDI